MTVYLPIIVTVFAIAAAIAALAIFFTLWSRVDRFINGERIGVLTENEFLELKNKPVTIHLKSGRHLENVVTAGWCSLWREPPVDFRQLLVVSLADRRRAYVRAAEVEYIEALQTSTV